MNKASCLSLISNAILVYNTPRVVGIIEQAREKESASTSSCEGSRPGIIEQAREKGHPTRAPRS